MVVGKNDKFVAAVSCKNLIAVAGGFYRFGDLLQRIITLAVPELVVYIFQTVHINKHYHDILVFVNTFLIYRHSVLAEAVAVINMAERIYNR